MKFTYLPKTINRIQQNHESKAHATPLHMKYLFQSNRLGFRNWTRGDLPQFAEMNADKEVTQHFPKPLTNAETAAFIDRLQQHYATHGFNYFAVEILETQEWIGFIGLAQQSYVTAFTPAVDIGWRLKRVAWGNGYATEGAKRCLEFGFSKRQLDRIISTCTAENLRSENVMKKIGMYRKGLFEHPRLEEFPRLKKCVWYEVRQKKHSENSDSVR